MSRALAVAGGLIAVVIVVGIVRFTRPVTPDEVNSVVATKAGVPPPTPMLERSPDSIPGGSGNTNETETIASLDSYPVNLDALRTRLPGNRYWELGAPTSDPAVAKARAERARRDNVAFGRIQSGEASPSEIRAYYEERRAISRDYLQLSELVLAEQGDALPERDRGMFELSVTLHRARLVQIDRDEADAMARRGAR